MILLMILIVIVGALSAATIVMMYTDGRGQLFGCPPASHVEDRRFQAPGSVL